MELVNIYIVDKRKLYLETMKKTKVSLMEKKRIGLQQNQSSTQRKLTSTNPRVTRKNISMNMVNTRSNNEPKTKKKLEEEPNVLVKEIGLETPDQSIDKAGQKKPESTPMQNVEEQGTKTIEFSPIGNVEEITNNTTETMKGNSQTKRKSFTERFLAIVGMKPKKKRK